jgi:hypothetical protein
MDIKKELLRGHSMALTDKIVTYIGADQRRFNTLINIFLEGTYQVTQRAAWSVSHCVRNHPSLIGQHYGPVLKILAKPGIHDAVKRHVMRFLQYVEVPLKYQGLVIEHCFRLMDPKEPVAVRVFAMTVLANLAKQHPDLKKELRLIIEDQRPFGTAAYLSRSKKILRQLEK